MVDRGGLENRYARKGIEGSNPFPSANSGKRVTTDEPPTGGLKVENTKNYNWSAAQRR